MSYSTSKKIAIINEIDAESRELWVMLNNNIDDYEVEDVKQLFIDIVSRDEGNYTRFNVDAAKAHIESAVALDAKQAAAGNGKFSKFDALAACYRVTRKGDMHTFLFNTAQ